MRAQRTAGCRQRLCMIHSANSIGNTSRWIPTVASKQPQAIMGSRSFPRRGGRLAVPETVAPQAAFAATSAVLTATLMPAAMRGGQWGAWYPDPGGGGNTPDRSSDHAALTIAGNSTSFAENSRVIGGCRLGRHTLSSFLWLNSLRDIVFSALLREAVRDERRRCLLRSGSSRKRRKGGRGGAAAQSLSKTPTLQKEHGPIQRP
jgi:hypothetical protein